MDIFNHVPTNLILFFIIYGITGVVPLMAAVYLLLRRSNAFAPDVTPPLRLRRWAAAFFAVSALSHVWWLLFIIYSGNIHSSSYVVVAVVDCVGMMTTIAGTLLSMLQDRRRPVWPVVVALIPYAAIASSYIFHPDDSYLVIAFAYILAFYLLLTIYVAFAVKQYGRWLRDNYADLERKEVWRSQVLMLVFMLLFILYVLVDIKTTLLFLLHFVDLVLFSFLLWRVETLPQLENSTMESALSAPDTEKAQEPEPPTQTRPAPAIVPELIQRLLDERCVAAQLYLKHDLTLQQLASAVGFNRFYLSQFFSNQGKTYNTYINDLRINHFVCLYREAVMAGRAITAQQLAYDSGYRSYSTFSLAFKQRMGQSVTSWIHNPTK